jgi:hypothetical protein
MALVYLLSTVNNHLFTVKFRISRMMLFLLRIFSIHFVYKVYVDREFHLSYWIILTAIQLQ